MGNKIQGCLRHEFNDTDYDAMLLQLHIVNCVIGTADFGRLHLCMEEVYPPEIFGPSYQQIVDCATGSERTNILVKMGEKTVADGYYGQGVPWVTVDGKYEEEAVENLSQYLCR